jgi:hypothetical protein
LEELKTGQTFNFLNDKVIQYTQEHKEEKKLLKELAEYGLTAPGLKRELASSKLRTQQELSHNLQKLATLQVMISQIALKVLKFAVQDRVAKERSENKIRLAFAANWEEARTEQVGLALQGAEKKLIDKLNKVEEDTSNELRAHSELRLALEKAILVIPYLHALKSTTLPLLEN